MKVKVIIVTLLIFILQLIIHSQIILAASGNPVTILPDYPVDLNEPNADGEKPFKVFLPVVITNGASGTVPPVVTPPPPQAVECDYTIGPEVRTADARVNYTNVSPGDTVCIKGGQRGLLVLKNFTGTAQKPITFINVNGQVVISSSDYSGLSFANSRFFRLTGTGKEGVPYGFKIIASTYTGLVLSRKTGDYEIDHIEVVGVPRIGVQAGTDDEVCSDGSTNNYDYDGDGNFANDRDDVVNRNNFTQTNSVFHDNYIHQVGTVAFYVGSSFYKDGRTLNCASGTETVFPPTLKGVNIYKNKIEYTGRDGIQVGSAVANCNIHNNYIFKNSQAAVEFQQSGIMNNSGSVCNIFNNFIKEGGPGIFVQGNGNNKIYNNIIINAGSNGGSGGNGIGVVVGSNTDKSIDVLNNTIINPGGFGILYTNTKGPVNKIQNNIIINPGNLVINGDQAYIMTQSSNKTLVVSNNLTSQTISAVKFVDPAADNYSLQRNSPAIDSGANLKDETVLFDYQNVARPQRSGYDIGAFEVK